MLTNKAVGKSASWGNSFEAILETSVLIQSFMKGGKGVSGLTASCTEEYKNVQICTKHWFTLAGVESAYSPWQEEPQTQE